MYDIIRVTDGISHISRSAAFDILIVRIEVNVWVAAFDVLIVRIEVNVWVAAFDILIARIVVNVWVASSKLFTINDFGIY
jgi:hypothetical protein